MNIDTKLKAWKPLQVGNRVVSKTYHRGVTGIVVECLGSPEDPMNGLRGYGVRMDDDTANITDFVRWELKRLPKSATPNRRIQIPLVSNLAQRSRKLG